MRKITFGDPVLKVEGLETKFDVVPVSNSLAILIGDRDLATIVQQLSYWTFQGYGEVIDGVRWFYKPIAEWIEEVFPTFTPWKLGKMMKQLSDRGIIRREKLFTKHQIQRGDRFWWQPKNQTYYYSLDSKKLQKIADNFQTSETAETPENSVSIKTQILSNEEIDNTKDFDCAKNNTDITSIENNSIDKSHPHLPCVSESSNPINREASLVNLANSKVQEIDSASSETTTSKSNVPQIDEKINQNKGTNKCDDNVVEDVTVNVAEQQVSEVAESPKHVSRPRVKTLKGTKSVSKRMKSAPWKDEEQFKRFYRALIQALPIVANARSPQGLAQVIIRQLRSGIPHSYWDDFAAGLPIGASTKPEWEIEPGVPYPMFIEYLTEKIIRGNNTQTQEQARNEVFRILDKPRQATAFWGQFKCSVVNVSKAVERDRALGVSSPNTPVWSRERIEPSVEDAAAAGKKIMAANGATQAAIESSRNPRLESTQTSDKSESPALDPWTDKSESEPEPKSKPDVQRSGANPLGQLSMREMLAARGVKGFCKPMPRVSKEEAEAEERARTKPKINIATMAIAEINDYLTDPILRAQLTPQLINSNYELITDYLGQIIAVKLSEDEMRERRSQSSGE